MAEEAKLNPWDDLEERKFVVRLFKLAYERAEQLNLQERCHPHDLFIDASSVLNTYEKLSFGA